MIAQLEALLADVDLLSLDAGGTIIMLDLVRLAAVLARNGIGMTTETLAAAEGKARFTQEQGKLKQVTWAHSTAPGAAGWGAFLAALLREAGVSEPAVHAVLPAIWAEHLSFNLWSVVPAGLPIELAGLRERSLKVVVVSNSEGMLEPHLARVGLSAHIDLVIDSGRLGIEKPDRRIFEAALAPFGVAPARALHVGDSLTFDALGARAAGLKTALIDRFDHFATLHLDIPRLRPG